MTSARENSDIDPRSAEFAKSAKKIAVLLSIDIALIVAAAVFQGSRSGIGRIALWSAFSLHTPIGIWIGIIITKSYRNKWVLAAYWFSVIAPPVSPLAPFIFIPLHMLFPFGPLPTGIFIQWSILIAILSGRFGKGRWPLPVAVLFAICAAILIFMNLSFETTEFGPLGMMFGNMFASSFFLILPALIRIPAADGIKVYMARLQYVTYGLVAFAWIVFGIRTLIC
jgi:hypothetical protein